MEEELNNNENTIVKECKSEMNKCETKLISEISESELISEINDASNNLYSNNNNTNSNNIKLDIIDDNIETIDNLIQIVDSQESNDIMESNNNDKEVQHDLIHIYDIDKY